MPTLIHIADRVLNRPLLVTRDKAQVILQVLAGRIGINSPEASRFEGSQYERDADGNIRGRPYKVANGVGIITITGSLVNRGAWIGASSGLTSYEGIQHQLKTAMRDDTVRSVILDIHSPGGEAVGAFETAAMVRKLAAEKRTVAIVNGLMASAAYAIGSGAGEIVTTETGVSGSIGVVLLHADFSKNLANEGIDPTLIFAGAHKVDGNPFEPLPDEVRADMQSEVNAFYDLFLKTVAQGRGGRTSVEDARNTEARVFIGEAAVKAKLADRVGTFEGVLEEFTQGAQSGRATVQQRRLSMDTTKETPGAEATAGITQADLDTAVEAAKAEGREEGATAATERLTSILGAEKIKGSAARMTAAIDLAAKAPGMSADEVTAFVTANVAEGTEASSGIDKVLSKMDAAANGVESTVSGDGGESGKKPAATTPDGWKAEWEASEDLQTEYPTVDAYVAMKKREARKAA